MSLKKLGYNILKILRKIAYTIFIIILVFDILYAINGILNSKKQLNIFGFEFLKADYKNVNPSISKGDLIIVKNSAEENLKIGDTIVFEKAKKIITRQIYSITQKKDGIVYETKGTENEDIDSWTLRINQIEGKYLGRILKIGYIVKLLQNKIILIIVIILVLLKKRYDIKLKNKKIRRIQKKENSRIQQKGEQGNNAKIKR